MAVTICTGFSPKGRKEYGENFLRTFAEFWPSGVHLACYVEETDPALEALAPQSLRSLWDCPGAKAFIEDHKGNLMANGRRFVQGMNWKSGDHRLGYSWRYDAVKFSRQCIIPLEAARRLPDGDVLVWLDADVVSFRQIPPNFAENLLESADGCYLGRERKHSEIGFWAVRLSPKIRIFLADLASAYTERLVFQQKEWHSAYTWDRCRERAEAAGAKFKNLSRGGHDHVWFSTPLGTYMDHLKGNRKFMGRSPERPA